jgi:hypothetical protein
MAVFGLLSLQVLVPRQFALVCHSVNMEWSVKWNHMAVIALHNCGKSHSQIFKLLKPLNISRMFMYLTFKHYTELLRVENRARSGRVKSVRVEAAIKTTGADSLKTNSFSEKKMHLCYTHSLRIRNYTCLVTSSLAHINPIRAAICLGPCKFKTEGKRSALRTYSKRCQ